MILKNYLRHPVRYAVISLSQRGYLRWLPDKTYNQWVFWAKMKKHLDLKKPKTYNEKLQWLKLYGCKPEYTQMVDKYGVRQLIAEKIGQEYLIPLVGGPWENPEEIDFDALPDQFVLKCTHDSGGLVICRDKSKLDVEAAKAKLSHYLKRNYYLQSREKPYKDVPRRIIAETYMEDNATAELRDYKFFCFDGQVKALFIATDRASKTEETKFDFFDEEYNHLPFTNGHPNAYELPQKPVQFEKMKELAKVLSKGIPHVRVDFYEVNGRVYFGELTFYHWSGAMPFEPEQWDYTFGDWIKLPTDKQ